MQSRRCEREKPSHTKILGATPPCCMGGTPYTLAHGLCERQCHGRWWPSLALAPTHYARVTPQPKLTSATVLCKRAQAPRGSSHSWSGHRGTRPHPTRPNSLNNGAAQTCAGPARKQPLLERPPRDQAAPHAAQRANTTVLRNSAGPARKRLVKGRPPRDQTAPHAASRASSRKLIC